MHFNYMDRDKYFKVVSADIPQDCSLKFWRSKIVEENELVIDLRGIGKDIIILKNVGNYKSIFLKVIKENNFVYEKRKDCFR